MPSRNVYHVVPSDGRWGVRLEGSPTLSYETDTQEGAIDRASGYVRQLGAGRVVVHGDRGQIQTVHTFDQLPVREPSFLDLVLTKPVLVGVGVAALVAFGYGLSRR
ncbi:MAG: DUF2188 domain-containing protein [Bacteroidota bacterium]